MPTATAALPRIHVPSTLEFGDDQFTPAPDLSEIAEHLIAKHDDVVGHLSDIEVAILWKAKGGKKSGSPVFGKAIKPSGVMTAFTTADAVVWLAADHIIEAEYSDRQVQALLLHELQHITVEYDEDGQRTVGLRGHDFEGFLADVRINGAWDELLKAAADAFAQAPLFD